jgi:hypothetical protein
MTAEQQSPLTFPDRLDVQAVLARWSDSRRKAAHTFLDLYERTVGQLAEAHVKSARAVDLPNVVTIAERQAEMGRGVADAYVTAARKLLER